MAWALDGDRPIYAQLVERLKVSVLSGRFAPGDRLPSVRDLAMEAGVNPNTMQRALSQLELEGLVVTQRTTGRTVTEDATLIERCRSGLARSRTAGLAATMAELGFAPAELPDSGALSEGRERITMQFWNVEI